MGRADEWVQILGSMHDDFNGVHTIKRDAFGSDADYSNALFVAREFNTREETKASVRTVHESHRGESSERPRVARARDVGIGDW